MTAALAGCRAPCTLDVDQPLCVDRFRATELLVHRSEPDDTPRRAGAQVVGRAVGDILLGADWGLAARGETLVVGFPDTGAASTLPPFEDEGACTAATPRELSFIPDVTVRRQPRLQIQVGSCANRSRVLFTGPSDFGRVVLPWERDEDSGWDLWVAAPGEGLFRGAIYGFQSAGERPASLRNHEVADVVLEGPSPGDRLGTVMARCPDPTGGPGDVLAISLPGWAGHPGEELRSERGAIALFRTASLAGGQWTLDQALTVLQGTEEGERAGVALACGRDLSGNGLPDLIVGAPGASVDHPLGGAVYLVSGLLPRRGDLRDVAGRTVHGDAPYVELGRSVAQADLDDDGIADLVAGAPGLGPPEEPGAGGVVIVLGSDLWARIDRRTTLLGRAVGSDDLLGRLGTTVVVSDLDGDGVPNITAGAWRVPFEGRIHAGELRSWQLTAEDFGQTLTASDADAILGERSHRQLGRRLITADLDGDGAYELVSATRRRAR